MKKLRVVQVGTGIWVHSAHLANAMKRRNDLYEVCGLVEEDPELRKRAETREEFQGIPFITWEEAVKLAPDAIMVETDEHQLVRNAIRSLEAGFHTYMDKPGSEDSAEFHKMCRLAEEKDLVLSLGYMFRGNPAILYAQELQKNGTLGKVFSVEAHMSNKSDASYHEQLKRFKGGMMYYLGCHMIDMVVHFCGFPEEVIPLNSRTFSENVDCVDYGFCAFRYPNGVSFVKTCTSEINGVDRRSVIISGSKGTVEIRPIEVARGDGSDDTICYVTDNNDHPFSDGRKEVKLPPHYRYDWLLENFVRYVRKEAVNPYTPAYEAKLHDLILQACR